jgi:hypothetical protein
MGSGPAPVQPPPGSPIVAECVISRDSGGTRPNHLDNPDDALLAPNGRLLFADKLGMGVSQAMQAAPLFYRQLVQPGCGLAGPAVRDWCSQMCAGGPGRG